MANIANISKMDIFLILMESFMKIKSVNLAWIVVKDLKKAIKFYTEVVGLKLMEFHEQFGWAELEGHEGGLRIGLGQMQAKDGIQPGQNAVITLTVDDIEQAIGNMVSKGAKLIGDVEEVPGHVKMQMVVDEDNNHFQLVELIPATCCSCPH